MPLTQEERMTNNTEIIKIRSSGEPLVDSFRPGQNRGEKLSREKGSRQPVVTIDDLESLVEQLSASIRILKTYRYPLALRRGVKTNP